MIAAEATNMLMERWITAAILHEQQKDGQDRLVDHDRRLTIAGVVAQMRQADALERIANRNPDSAILLATDGMTDEEVDRLVSAKIAKDDDAGAECWDN